VLTVFTLGLEGASDLRQGVIQIRSSGGDFAVPVQAEGMPDRGDDSPPTDEFLLASLPGGATMEFVWIYPGAFLMGSPDGEIGRYSDEGPQHEAEISQGFYLGKYEITQEQWESVQGTRPWSGQDLVEEDPEHPAVFISWNAVQNFIRLLNEAAGADVYRLPTEAEWEYAARAGSGTRWSFGDDADELDEHAWYRTTALEAGEDYAHQVGLKRPNPWGLHDMHGNVWEWIQDRYANDYYSRSPVLDPAGPLTGLSRVIRGGDFRLRTQDARSARRFRFSPSSRINVIGARLVLIQELPELGVFPSEIQVTGRLQETTLELRNVGSGRLDWSVSEDLPWLEVRVAEDGADGDEAFSGQGDITLKVRTYPEGTQEGLNQGVIRISSNGGAVDIPVQMMVRPDLVVTLPGGALLEMVWIDPGSFLMGSPEQEFGRYDDEGPLHEVEISQGFYLARYELTQAQWESVMQTRPWADQELARQNPAHPAVDISWNDAQELIRQLNEAEGEDIYRLPTEAEWEYAARAGSEARWSFGDDVGELDNFSWYRYNAWDKGQQYAHPVGGKQPNAWELYDMHGNVWEWVQDWYASDYYYAESAALDPPGAVSGSFRTIRGGAFFDNPRDLRAARRPGYLSERGFAPGVGMRLVRVRE
jgi:formylglycine-generating enzyme required for sulfatase activity